MISKVPDVALLQAGKRVGIMSNSHKAINHLLAAVVEAGTELGVEVDAVKKSTAQKPDSEYDDLRGGVTNVYSNGDA